MRCFLRSTLVLIALVLLSAPAAACTCAHPGIVDLVEEHGVVFEGRVASTRVLDVDSIWTWVETTFEVVRSWKGPATSEIEVVTYENNGANCGETFVPGTTYVVIADTSEPVPPLDRLDYDVLVTTDECNFSFAVDDVAELLYMPHLETLGEQVPSKASSWSRVKALY